MYFYFCFNFKIKKKLFFSGGRVATLIKPSKQTNKGSPYFCSKTTPFCLHSHPLHLPPPLLSPSSPPSSFIPTSKSNVFFSKQACLGYITTIASPRQEPFPLR